MLYTADVTLEKDMGPFGGEHCDSKDNPGFITNMETNHDLPDDYDPGRFYILLPGVFVTLKNYTSINFSGLRFHGGTPPLAPIGVEPAPHAYRFVVVSYPPTGMTDGNSRYALGAMPDHSTMYIPAEMTNVE